MASFLEKVKRFLKRTRDQSEPSDDAKRPEKRVRYFTTPAHIKFSPKQILHKRVQRSFYVYEEVLRVTEDRNYEFKAGGLMLQSQSLREYIRKYGSAFLNSEGGVLLGGVRDDGKVLGVFCNSRKSTDIYYTVKEEFEKFRPPVSHDKYKINFIPVYKHGREILHCTVVEIHIYKGDEDFLYESGRHEVFIRRDGGVQGPLRPLAIKDVLEQKYQKVLAARRRTESKKNEFGDCDNKKERVQMTKIDVEKVTSKENDLATMKASSHEASKASCLDEISKSKEAASSKGTLSTRPKETSVATSKESESKEASSSKGTLSTRPKETSVATSKESESKEASRSKGTLSTRPKETSVVTSNEISSVRMKEAEDRKNMSENITSIKECSRKRKVEFIDLTNTEDEETELRPIKIKRNFEPIKTARKFFADVRNALHR